MLIDGRKFLTTLKEYEVSKKYELCHLKFSRSGKARIQIKIDDYVHHIEEMIAKSIHMWALKAEEKEELERELARVQEATKSDENLSTVASTKAK